MLERDPAFEKSPWELPALNSVLAWDGVVRQTAGLDGMAERRGVGSEPTAVLAPPKGDVGGPSADAEITAAGVWNPDYNAAYHYWNPWLKCGESPSASGDLYASLVEAIVKDKGENAKAKAASHLSHYIADTVCAKHADMIALGESELKQLSQCADRWFAEHAANPTMSLTTWLGSRELTDAVGIVVRASGVSLDHPFWRRVEAHLGGNPLLNANESSMRGFPDVAAPSLRTSVGGLLGALHERPDGKNLVRFYGFFDPFYYNGQMLMTYEKSLTDWDPRSAPEFGLVTPGSEHLMWESNPELARYVNGHLRTLTLGKWVDRAYVALPDSSDLRSPDAKTRMAAYQEAMAEFVRKASVVQHGTDPLKGDDFDHSKFESSLLLSIKYFFSALRSCITAIRCDSSYAFFPKEKKYRVYCDLGNAAEETVEIEGIRVSLLRDGKLYTCPSWTKKVTASVAQDAEQRVTIELPAKQITEDAPEFVVDVFGRYKDTPDLGFWRGEADQRPPRIMHGMSLPAFDRVEGALDLAICFDVTGSMGSSIDSVRSDAISILGKLKERLGDMRVALVSFRDIKEDKENAFSVTPFSTDIEKVFGTMNSWKAEGGGDTPEDQLAAISLALDMWADKTDPRKPTKIVVVITDAPPHDPDVNGNTQASIADYAERVDPAHIYPIIVGGRTEAKEKAAELAALTGGEVLSAKSGEEVATVLSAAVETAVATHGGTGQDEIPPGALFYGGLSAMVVGGWWLWRGRRRREAT